MFDTFTTKHYAALGAGVALLIGLGLWLAPEPPAEPTPAEAIGVAPPTGESTVARAPLPAASMPNGIDPMSTKFDPAQLFDIGYAGGLRIDEETQSKLDQIVAAMGENPTDADMAKIERALREGLPREDAEKAIKLVHGYKGYVTDTRKDLTTHGIPTSREAVDAMFQRMQNSQSRHFDPQVSQALFGTEMREGRLVMEAALIEQDPNLSFDEKKQKLQELQSQLPERKRNSIVVPTQPPQGAASAPTTQ